MTPALQFELPFRADALNSWTVEVGDQGGLSLEVTLTGSGAEASLTVTNPALARGARSDQLGFVPHWEAKVSARPPVRATLKLESESDSTNESDIPVPGPDLAVSWDLRPFFAKPLALAASLLGREGLLRGMPIVRRSLGLMASHLDNLWVKRGVEAARLFPPQGGMRWFVYAAALGDETGRIAQLARTCPGILILSKALTDHDEAGMAEVLFELVVRGQRLGKVLDGAQMAWTMARHCVSDQGKVHLAAGWLGDKVLATQRLRIKCACPLIPPWVLWNGVPACLVPEDIPREDSCNLDWFLATLGPWKPRAERRLTNEQLNGLFRFLSYNWRWARQCQYTLGEDWNGFMDHLVDYLAATGRVLRRRSSPSRLQKRLNEWEVDLIWKPSTYAIETRLETHGLKSWQGEHSWFKPLQTVGDLREESRRMNHCVVAYSEEAVRGRSIIVHGEIHGTPVTVQLKPDEKEGLFHFVEAVGNGNRYLDQREMEVIIEWMARPEL